MIETISNKRLTVKIDTHGAELQSIKDENGRECLWCGDPQIWEKKSPVLFPICGSLKDGKYSYNGKEYELPKHGFALRSDFEVMRKSDTEVEFMLKSNEQTKKSYPFDFELSIVYKVDTNKLITTYTVRNTGENKMYFSLGAHESYSCPEGVKNYCVIFDRDTSLETYDTIDGLLTDEPTIKELRHKTLKLNDGMFANDDLIFKNFDSRKITLLNKITGSKAQLDFDGFDYLLIWKKPVGNYICLEPWTGLPDSHSSSGILSEKEGITALGAGKEYSVTHTISYWD